MKQWQIRAGHLQVTVTNFGASLVDVRLAPIPHALVLGLPKLEHYRHDPQFLGAIIGRYANRIAGGTASTRGQSIQLECNERGRNHLHGGTSGFGQRFWNLVSHREDAVTFSITSAHGESGYPGELQLEATYQVTENDALSLCVSANTTQATPINICHHPYFTLDDRPNIDQHRLQVFAPHVLPSDEFLIPTGELQPVAGTEFDFLTPRLMDDRNYNHTFCLHNQPVGRLAKAARVETDAVHMELWTTQPGLHVYNGYKLHPLHPGHDQRNHKPRSGLCLEAQAWPDSPNRSHFPNTELLPSTTYRQLTEYRFSVQ